MKKCSFLSPEALLQAEIFGSGGGDSPTPPSDYFNIDNIFLTSGLYTIPFAVWSNSKRSGVAVIRLSDPGEIIVSIKNSFSYYQIDNFGINDEKITIKNQTYNSITFEVSSNVVNPYVFLGIIISDN